MRAHQPGSTPIDIPETVPNPAHAPTPAPAPERAPTKVPDKVPEKVLVAEPPRAIPRCRHPHRGRRQRRRHHGHQYHRSSNEAVRRALPRLQSQFASAIAAGLI
jgi:hypothetical protein